MSLRTLSTSILISGIIFILNFPINAQFNERISQTLGKKNSSAGNSLMEKLANRQSGKPAKSDVKSLEVVQFTRAGNSGVPSALGEALGQNPEQKTVLSQAFQQIKEGYETEVAKAGKSNNLAAAMTFFISANVMVYYQTEMPSDQVSENLYESLQEVMGDTPAFAEMSNAEKQKMHDWLVCMAGFAMTNYLEGKQNNDAQAIANIKSFAGYSIQLVLGVEAKDLSFSFTGLNVQNNHPVSNTATGQSSNQAVIGTWTKSSSLSTGIPGTIEATQKIMTNAGSYRTRYIFNPDGTYTFKSLRWGGYYRSEEWWTTEETGTYSVKGNTITISAKTSKATLRNSDGVVQKTQNNPLETITYKWEKHYFEGINEMNLVLQTSQATTRDGTLEGNSLFPNSYLYAQGDKLEWKF